LIRRRYIIIMSMLLLTGCWDRVELQDLAIITAAAIDRLDDGRIRISVQVFIPRAIASGESGEDPSSGSTFVREGMGNSLAEAVAILQTNLPRNLFWGQCRIYIFGINLAKAGIRKEIDFLVRHPSPRGTSFLYVSEDEAKETLSLMPPLERYSGEALRKLSQNEFGVDSTLRDVDMGLIGEGNSFTLPLIKRLIPADKTKSDNQTIPIIYGTAIFRKDKMVGQLNMSETRGLVWLTRTIRKSTISVKPKGHDTEITMAPTLGKVKFKPLITNNRWIMNVEFQIEGDTVQNETLLNLFNKDVIKELEKEYERALKERVSQTIEKLQDPFHADVINFGRRFHQKYPKQWKKVKNRWEEKFTEVEVKINVIARIRRPGDIGPPAGISRDEVEQK
jgi:spore germination protein KC